MHSIAIANSEVQVNSTEGEAGDLAQFLGAKTAVHPDWFKVSFLDFSEDIDEAAADGKRLALYFWQEGCPYCNQLWEHNMAVDDIEANFKDNFDVVAINMWGDKGVISVGGKSFTEKQLAAALRVNFTPTLIFYDESKEQALRLNGYYPPQEFQLALNYVKEKQEKVQSLSAYMEQELQKAAPDKLLNQSSFLPSSSLRDLTKEAAERPVAVLFERPDCKDCDYFHESIVTDPVTENLLAQIDVVQLDAFSNEAITLPDGTSSTPAQWAQQLGLVYYPSMVFFDENGKQIVQMDSALRRFHVQSIMAYVAEQAYLTEPSFQRFISARADALIEQGIDVDIWQE